MAFTTGSGSTLKVTISASPTLIPQITSMKIPKVMRNIIETTDLDSTWDTALVGIKRSEPFTFTVNWDPAHATHQYLWTSQGSGTLEAWLFTMAETGASTVGFNGYITSDESNDIVVDGLVQKTFTVKPSSTITLTQ